MENQNKQQDVKFSDYVYVLYKWRKFLLLNTVLILLLAISYSFLLPVTYKSTAVIMVPPESSIGIGGLSSLLGGRTSAGSLGARLLGSSSNSEDILFSILRSRTAMTQVIDQFNLMDYYEIEDKNIDKALRSLQNDFKAESNEFGMIEISVINKNPVIASEIVNYFVKILDSLNIRFNIEQARNNRIFIEKRYFQNVIDLKNAEDSLHNFQKKYGIVAVPEQLEISIKAAAEVESQLIRKEMESFFIKQSFGEDSPQYLGTLAEINLIKDKIQELKNSPDLTASSNILFPFTKMPDISIQFLRTFREVEIQQSILEIILPMYEQSKIEEQKSIPTIMVLDKAYPPQLKFSPKRALVVLSLTFIFFFFIIIIIFIGEKSVNRYSFSNPIEEKSSIFFSKLLKIYRIKF